MRNELAVFELQNITDNPLFEGFAFASNRSLRGTESLDDDFMPDDLSERNWVVPRLAKVWKPQKVIGGARPSNDFPCVNILIPAFSRRAVDVLHDLLEPNGELLPLISEIGEYYAFNVTTVSDALDLGHSVINWLSDTNVTASSIDRFEFKKKKLKGLSIFRLVELPSWTFVTSVFEERVFKHELKGFRFNKLWPLPKDVHWRNLSRAQWKEGQKIATKDGLKEVKGNTLVLRLMLSGKKPTKQENLRIAEIREDLDNILIDRAKGSNYFGSLEGVDIITGEIRLFVSCPDVDILIKKLTPWLQNLGWPGDKYLLKRYGEYVDQNAVEEYIDLTW